jgi:hypothetical protein
VREYLDEHPEPNRLIGRSLSLTFLVIRHQVPRGCPFTESSTHEECLWTQPACCEKTGTRAQKGFSGVALAGTTVLHPTSERISTLNRCLVQPQAVTSNRNQVSCKSLALAFHFLFSDGPSAPAMPQSVHLTTEP